MGKSYNTEVTTLGDLIQGMHYTSEEADGQEPYTVLSHWQRCNHKEGETPPLS